MFGKIDLIFDFTSFLHFWIGLILIFWPTVQCHGILLYILLLKQKFREITVGQKIKKSPIQKCKKLVKSNKPISRMSFLNISHKN